MAEALDPWKPSFWAASSLATLQNNLVFGNLVYRDFEPLIASSGQTVNTRKPGTFTTNLKTATGSVTVQDAIAQNYSVTLNKHREVTFTISDDALSMGLEALLQTHMVPAMQAMATAVDLDIYNCIADNAAFNFGTVGSPATVPDTLTSGNKIAGQRQWPLAGRNFVVGPTVEEIFLKATQFTSMDYVPDNSLQNALLGRKWGADLYMSQQVEGAGFVQAAASGYLINGAVTAGSTSFTIVLDTGTGVIAAGAKISVGGEQYAVNAISGTLPAYTITTSAPIRVNIADNAAVTVLGAAGATYQRLPYFQRESVMLVNRPLALPRASAVAADVIQDGSFSMRALVSYDKDKLGHQITIDCLYGVAPADSTRSSIFVY